MAGPSNFLVTGSPPTGRSMCHRIVTLNNIMCPTAYYGTMVFRPMRAYAANVDLHAAFDSLS